MEDFWKLIRVFVENHLIPTIGSISISLIVLLIIPSDYWMISKLGDSWFKVLLFCFFFLVIEGIIYISKSLPARISNKRYEKEINEEKLREAEKTWQGIFDHLTKYELELIKELVQNNNNPVKREYRHGPGIHSSFLQKNYRNYEYGGHPFIGEDDFQNDIFICTTQFEGNNDQREPYRVYKLTEVAFIAAKHILETKGRLSTYEEVEQYAD